MNIHNGEMAVLVKNIRILFSLNYNLLYFVVALRFSSILVFLSGNGFRKFI